MADATNTPGVAGGPLNGREPPTSLSPRVANAFRVFARMASERLGSPWAFILAVGIVVGWAISGLLFRFSTTWQLVINTGTTIVTFLMVFLLQNTQNRDSLAIHLKLDELLRGTKGTRTGLVNLEQLSDEDLAHLQEEFKRLSERHGASLEKALEDLGEELEERRQGDDEVRGAAATRDPAPERKAEEHRRAL